MELGEILQELQRTLNLLLKVIAAGHNQIVGKLELMRPSERIEPNFEKERGVSVLVDTNPTRE